MVDDVIFATRQLEILLFGDYDKRIKVRLFTDSEFTLTSIASSKMWADILTKEKRLLPDLEDVLVNNIMDLPDHNINEVKAVGTEIRIENIRNCRACINIHIKEADTNYQGVNIFKEECDPCKGTGSEIYRIKKVTRKRTQRPIMESSMPNINQSNSRFRHC